MACGVGAYVLGILSTLLILFVLVILAHISERIRASRQGKAAQEPTVIP